MQTILRAALGTLLAALAPAASSPPAPAGSPRTTLVEALEAIREDAIRSDLFFLASDELGGRDTPSSGLRVAARFLRARLQRFGWKPGAPDGYFYEWTRQGLNTLDEAVSHVTLARGETEKRLAFGDDYFFESRGASDLDLSGGAVFCGKGGEADFEGRELAGRWAVCLDSDVGWRERDKAARASGALGLVVVPPPDHPGESYPRRFANDIRWLREGGGGSGRRSRSSGDAPFSTVFLTPEAAAPLGLASAAAGADLGWMVHEMRKLVPVTLENVCGFWAGSDPELSRDVIIVSAHYDHIGTKSDGTIYNGADDNGSGTCTLMAVAEALARYGPLERSVLLMWVSGEEKGLWGSDAWTKAPWLPEGCRPFCDINIDMVGRNAPDKLLITPSRDHKAYNGLARIAERLAPLEGFPTLGSADEYWDRSDHRNFSVHLKIPVAFLFSDVHEDYHKPTDDPEKVDCDKVRRVSRLVVRILGDLQAPDVDID